MRGGHVNVAMVNYYFHGKEELYLAAFDHARALARASAAAAPDAGPAVVVAPVEQLRLAIEAMVCDMLRRRGFAVQPPGGARTDRADGRHPPAGRTRRARAPCAVYWLDPWRGGGVAADDVVQKCVFSVIGQAVFYARSRIVHELVAPEITYDEAGTASIARHVAAFSLAALDGLCANMLRRRTHEDEKPDPRAGRAGHAGPFATDTFLPSFPAIGTHFDVSSVLVQQTLSVTGRLCLQTLFYGTLSDSFGRRPVILASLLIFAAGSIGAAFAPSFGWLLFFRGMQGASAGRAG